MSIINAIVITAYVIQHLSSILLLNRSVRELILYVITGLLSYTLIYLFKTPSYDLLIYVEAFDYAVIFEPGYYLLSTSLINIGLSNEAALSIIQTILAVLFIYVPLKFTKEPTFVLEKVILFIIIISSVAFTLGVNNVIRQGYSSIFIMLSLYYFLKNRKLPCILFLILAVLFHKSAPMFWAYSIFIYYTIQFIYKGKIGSIRFLNFSVGVNRIILFLIPISVVVLLLFLLQNIFFSAYIGKNISAEDVTRTSAAAKTAIIFIVFIISEIAFGTHSRKLTDFDVLRFLRLAFFALVFWLSLNPMLDELASRVLYFYFIIELFVVVIAYKNEKKIGSIIILLSYAFALNAINNFTGGSLF